MKNEVHEKTYYWGMNIKGIIYNASDVRIGRMSLTVSTFIDMQNYKLNPDQLEETFRYGKEVEPGKIEMGFDNFKVGMFFVQDYTVITRGNLNLEKYLIIACWKQNYKSYGREVST